LCSRKLVILLLSLAVPLVVGFIVNRFRQDDMATVVWLLGLIWLMIVALWIVDMPTRPNECFQCGVTEKLTRTLAALIGYSIGAALALRKKRED
jgi:hypothetical protein